jgi:hypothetical protein
MTEFTNPLSGPAQVSPAARSQVSAAKQQDGTPISTVAKATKAPLQTRSASPNNYNTSGMERAMAAEADRLHPPKLRKPAKPL